MGGEGSGEVIVAEQKSSSSVVVCWFGFVFL